MYNVLKKITIKLPSEHFLHQLAFILQTYVSHKEVLLINYSDSEPTCIIKISNTKLATAARVLLILVTVFTDHAKLTGQSTCKGYM